MRKKICLWSCPRNVSTALMYSFKERPDTLVFDEPLYAHYLVVSGVKHPGREDTLVSQENDGGRVVKDIILGDYQKHCFFKLMTHFLVNINKDFLQKVTNIIFIRDPKEIIFSYSKVIKSPKMSDIGVKMQFDLFNYLENGVLQSDHNLQSQPLLSLSYLKLYLYLIINITTCFTNYNIWYKQKNPCQVIQINTNKFGTKYL